MIDDLLGGADIPRHRMSPRLSTSAGALEYSFGDLALPIGEVRLERLPGLKAVSCYRVVLDITDPALGLALGAGTVRRACPRIEAPVLANAKSLSLNCTVRLAGADGAIDRLTISQLTRFHSLLVP